MAVPFEEIADDFSKFRNFILNDVCQIVSRESGGNYAAVALITCACDAVAQLRYGSKNAGERVLIEMVPDEWRPVAKSLYAALRDGLVHGYDAKDILVDGRRVEITISWREEPHLTFSPDRQMLYVNVQQMASDLRAAFADYETLLRGDVTDRDHFITRRREGKELCPEGEQRDAWRALLNDARMDGG